MKIQQEGSLKQHEEYSALVGKQNLILQRVINGTAEATWELTEDTRGRPFLRLRLRDKFQGQGTGDFTPEELRNQDYLATRLRDLKAAMVHVGGWRRQLEQLHADVRSWLLEKWPTAVIDVDSIPLWEERSGKYEAPRLQFKLDGKTLSLEPVAAWVVGADGRADLKGPGGSAVLLYSRKEKGWITYESDTRFPPTSHRMTKTLFLQLAEDCLDG